MFEILGKAQLGNFYGATKKVVMNKVLTKNKMLFR